METSKYERNYVEITERNYLEDYIAVQLKVYVPPHQPENCALGATMVGYVFVNVMIWCISNLRSLTLTQITNSPILEHIVVTALSCAPISISIIHCCTRLVALLFVIKRKNAKFPGGSIHFALRSLKIVIALILTFYACCRVGQKRLVT
jgi:hypothetical protein